MEHLLHNSNNESNEVIRNIYLQAIDEELSQSIPPMEGYFTKQILQTNDANESITTINKLCSECGCIYGPGTVHFKIKSKFKTRKKGRRRKSSKNALISITCLNCKQKSLEQCVKRKSEYKVKARFKATPVKRLFLDNSLNKTPVQENMNVSLKLYTPDMVNNQNVETQLSKSAKKRNRMRTPNSENLIKTQNIIPSTEKHKNHRDAAGSIPKKSNSTNAGLMSFLSSL